MSTTNSFRRTALAAVAILGLGACASAGQPASLTQAEAIYTRLEQSGANARVEADMIKSREAIASAQNAAAQRENRDYVGGLSNIALLFGAQVNDVLADLRRDHSPAARQLADETAPGQPPPVQPPRGPAA